MSARAVLARGARLFEGALGSVTNRGFSSRLVGDPSGAVVVLSPHLDDAVLSCWSVLTSDDHVQPVNVFGKPPPPGTLTRYDRICGARDSSEHVRERVAEDARALESAGRAPVNMPFLDRQYRRPWQTPSLADLDRRLADAVPRVRELYAPAGLGFAPQPDHELVRRLAVASARAGIRLWLYADLPYAVTFGWPQWVTRAEEYEHLHVDALWEQLEQDVPGIGGIRSARVVRLPPDEAERKLAAMQEYRTQFAALDGGVTGLLRNPAIHGFEVFWEVKAVT
jgi:LmbE family N-acetylglucosaminyl deacetylase